MRYEEESVPDLMMCLLGRCCLAWNDISVGHTGQSLETVALIIFTRHPDVEALRGGAELWQSPQSMLLETRGRLYGHGA